jgi:hypothetical protein
MMRFSLWYDVRVHLAPEHSRVRVRRRAMPAALRASEASKNSLRAFLRAAFDRRQEMHADNRPIIILLPLALCQCACLSLQCILYLLISLVYMAYLKTENKLKLHLKTGNTSNIGINIIVGVGQQQ